LQGPSGRKPMKILTVDDEKAIANLTKRVLERHGHEVMTASSAEEGILAFSGDPHAFDLLITDHAMPGMSGLDLIEKVKISRPDLPTVLYSGYHTELSEARAKSLNVDALLWKPLTEEDLLDALQQFLP